MTATTILRFAALLGALSVALGAFGAHGLERLVTPERVYRTAATPSGRFTLRLPATAVLEELELVAEVAEFSSRLALSELPD